MRGDPAMLGTCSNLDFASFSCAKNYRLIMVQGEKHPNKTKIHSSFLRNYQSQPVPPYRLVNEKAS